MSHRSSRGALKSVAAFKNTHSFMMMHGFYEIYFFKNTLRIAASSFFACIQKVRLGVDYLILPHVLWSMPFWWGHWLALPSKLWKDTSFNPGFLWPIRLDPIITEFLLFDWTIKVCWFLILYMFLFRILFLLLLYIAQVFLKKKWLKMPSNKYITKSTLKEKMSKIWRVLHQQKDFPKWGRLCLDFTKHKSRDKIGGFCSREN